MIKTARKPSTDPAQEKLRQEKALWNKDVSAFVNDVIHLKKMMNGWPSKFHMEKSRIVDPIPADPATILGSLANDFNEIAQRGNKLVQQQLEYSKNRRKKQPKQLNLPLGNAPATPAAPAPSAPAGPDLTQQLNLPAVANADYDLIAEGSNPFTRFFARLLNPAIGGSQGARVRKYRMSMLSSALDTWKNFEKLQRFIMGSSPESIFTASRLLNKIEDQWIFLSQGFVTYKESMPKNVADVGGEIAPPNRGPEAPPGKPVDNTISNIDSNLAEAEKAVADFRYHITNFLDLNTKVLNSLVMKYSNATDDVKAKLAPELLSAYRSLLSDANAQYGTTGTSLKEIFESKNKKAASSQIEALAQSFLTKYLGKIKHQLSPFDKTSALRLDIYKKAGECKKDVDQIMNLLEKGMKVEELDPLINRVGIHIMQLKEMQRALDATIRGKGFDKSFINLLDQKNILEQNPNLTDKQKQNLQRMIEQRNLRDLTNIYRR